LTGAVIRPNVHACDREEYLSRGEIIGAFGENDAARLTGLTVGQLRA